MPITGTTDCSGFTTWTATAIVSNMADSGSITTGSANTINWTPDYTLYSTDPITWVTHDITINSGNENDDDTATNIPEDEFADIFEVGA